MIMFLYIAGYLAIGGFLTGLFECDINDIWVIITWPLILVMYSILGIAKPFKMLGEAVANIIYRLRVKGVLK